MFLSGKHIRSLLIIKEMKMKVLLRLTVSTDASHSACESTCSSPQMSDCISYQLSVAISSLGMKNQTSNVPLIITALFISKILGYKNGASGLI